MAISRELLEQHIARAAAHCHDPRAGIYGPGSKMWEISRWSVIMLGGGRAALLQVAHPYVAHAVTQHSAVMSDVAGRFQRTFLYVFNMIFGDLDDAVDASRRVHRIHETVTGRLTEDVAEYHRGHWYAANEHNAQFWVGATLWHTAIMVFERFVRPLSTPEKDLYLREVRRFGDLFAIPDELYPESWDAFDAYMQRMFASSKLGVADVGRELCKHILSPPNPAVVPPYAYLRALTAELLPPRFRDEFGLSYGAKERMLIAAAEPGVIASTKMLPDSVRYFPAYLDAIRRLDGKPGRHAVGAAIERAVIAGLGSTA